MKVTLNRNNEIVSLHDSHIVVAGDSFLYSNEAITSLELPSLTTAGYNFLYSNKAAVKKLKGINK